MNLPTLIYSKIQIQTISARIPLKIYESLEEVPFNQLKLESSNGGYFLSKDDILIIDDQEYKVTDFYLRFEKITTKNGIENNSTTFVIVENHS